MEKIKEIAMVAHDNRKKDLIEWVQWNWEILQNHNITCTGTTGRLVEDAVPDAVRIFGKSHRPPVVGRGQL